MGKKTKQGKGRQDKYYFLAKEQGFRSRAAFKLIQLNKKYDFLTQAKCVVDLCAAPGGWLQVCAKYMPIASIKIGVDLDPIPPIKGCVTFISDITTQKCLSQIKKELKHFKADIVLNDGAPNVGSNWNTDAYNQIELALHALKIATDVLRKGGWFICKVFRSKDFNSLLYVANQLFSKVESNKPQSSRSTSAEMFMVCQGYKAPDFIDPKLLDPKFALEDVNIDQNQQNDKTTSLKKLLTNKKNRSGYADDKEVLYAECDFVEFLNSADPHEYLSGFNKFNFDLQAEELIKDLKPPKDLKFICEDLKTCGRREFSELLKLRYKFNVENQRKLKEEKDLLRGDQNDKEITPEQLEAEVDKELQETIKRVEREKKKTIKKERERDQKQDLRKKMSVIASMTIDNDDELKLDKQTWDKLKKIDLDEAYKFIEPLESEHEEDIDPLEKKIRYFTDGGRILADQQDVVSDGDSDSEDSKVKRIDRMEEEINAQLQSRKDYKMLKGKREIKKELKAKAMIELQRQKAQDESEDEKLQNNDLINSENEQQSENDDDLEEKEIQKLVKEQILLKKQKKDQIEDEEEKQLFINPLLAFKQNTQKNNDEKSENNSQKSEEWSDDDKYEPKKKKESKKERNDKYHQDKKILAKRGKYGIEGDIDDVKDFFRNDPIEIVPLNDINLQKKQKKTDDDLPSGYSSMDSDDIAETRALAKKMLRKKFRTETIDSSYSRYAYEDDEKIMPSWFVEDEAKHNIPNINLTQEEIDEEKRILREWNARPSKKVMEAKNRKKMKLARAMSKVKSKALVIASQDISEGSKMRQIQKMYTKEKSKHVEEKTYVVNRVSNSAMGRKSGRGIKMVDTRLKKDQRNLKKKKKSKGGAGLSKVSKKITKKKKFN